MAAPKYDYVDITRQREEGVPWAEIADRHNAPDVDSLRSSYSRWHRRQANKAQLEADLDQIAAEDAGEPVRLLTVEDVQRITSLEQLVDFFKIDLARYRVTGFRVNKWEQHSNAKGVTPLYQVRANLVDRAQENAAEKAILELIEDAKHHAPIYLPVLRPAPLGSHADPVLYEVAINDPHIGMLAWGKEVGHPYDSAIASADYAAAADYLLSIASIYPVERILYVVGNDLLHVDQSAGGVKGSNRGGATTAGTSQDVDSRLAKMFTTARRAVVEAVDRARLIAPVDLLVVPGNHDAQQMYRLGEVLSAWYRNDPEVDVRYSPNKRSYYGYGANLLMFTHGEDYRRQRDSLPLIMATEAPPELWVASTHREIHTGHNHIAMAGRYTPTSDLNESRAIRTRSLPGLTPEDAWHHEEGYKHRRTATAIAFRKSGGVVGLHEFNL